MNLSVVDLAAWEKARPAEPVVKAAAPVPAKNRRLSMLIWLSPDTLCVKLMKPESGRESLFRERPDARPASSMTLARQVECCKRCRMLRTSLRYFMAVARLGSIRAASAQLNVAQSAVSRQVQALEHQLGTVLFDRLPNGVALTPSGTILYDFGRKVEFETEEMQSDLGRLNGLLRGHVRIAAIESMVPYVLPQAISRFRDSHPGITFAVEAAASEHIAGLVIDGSADIGVGLNAQVGPDFHVLSSTREALTAVTSPSHPLAEQSHVSLQALAQFPLALAPRRSASRVIFEDACRAAGIKVTPTIESNSVELVQRMATSGLGIALLLRHTIAEPIRQGKLVGLGLDKQLFAGTIDVFVFKDRKLPVAVQHFLSVLIEEMGA